MKFAALEQKTTRSDRSSECTTVDREGRGPISPTWTRCKRTRETRNAHPDGGQRVAQATGDPAVAFGTGVEVGGRKIEQEAEADTADDQAREHDLVNTSAPMPANPKHIDKTP